MTHRVRQIIPIVLALAAIGMSVQMARAADEEPPWDHTFNGHQMWSLNVDSALAASQAANKPLLVDLYKRH